MPTNIKIIMKDGETKDFPHQGRPGGSYTKKIRYEGDFVIITDEFYKETALPSHDIKEIKVHNY